MDYNEVRLEKLKMGVQSRLSRHLIEENIEAAIDYASNDIIIKLDGFLFSEENNRKPKEIKHCSDWWQAIKERWFPLWALKLWPVKYTVHNISFKVLYPDFNPQLPPAHRHCVVRKSYYEND